MAQKKKDESWALTITPDERQKLLDKMAETEYECKAEIGSAELTAEVCQLLGELHESLKEEDKAPQPAVETVFGQEAI